MLLMIVLEIIIYIYEFRWYIRFVIIYVLVGEATMFNLVLSVRQYYSSRYSTFVKFIFLMKLFSL
jgi:ATP-binding cassette, subfamily C (CFTR/MRP), member 1